MKWICQMGNLIFFLLYFAWKWKMSKTFFWNFRPKNVRHFETGGHLEKIFLRQRPFIIRFKSMKYEINLSNSIRVIIRIKWWKSNKNEIFCRKYFKSKNFWRAKFIFFAFFCLECLETKYEQNFFFENFWRKNVRHFETGGHLEKIFSSTTRLTLSYIPVKFEANRSRGIRVIVRTKKCDGRTHARTHGRAVFLYPSEPRFGGIISMKSMIETKKTRPGIEPGTLVFQWGRKIQVFRLKQFRSPENAFHMLLFFHYLVGSNSYLKFLTGSETTASLKKLSVRPVHAYLLVMENW